MKCLEKIIAGILLASVLLQPLGLVTPALAETVEMEYTDPNHLHAPNEVTVDGNRVDYQYDANGNLTFDGERRIEWNQDNLPIRITREVNGETQVVEFFYDASGRRIFKKSFLASRPDDVDTTTYVSGSYQESVVDGVETTTKYYFANGRVAVRNTTPSTGEDELTFLHQDHLGSTVLATNSSATPTSNSLAYFPYGKQTTSYQLPVTNYQFTGQELDPESDLYNYNARLYNPTTGAFISADSVGGGNRYAYAANNPLAFTDPTGHALDAGGGGGGSGNNIWDEIKSFVADDTGNLTPGWEWLNYTKLINPFFYFDKFIEQPIAEEYNISASQTIGTAGLLSYGVTQIWNYGRMIGAYRQVGKEAYMESTITEAESYGIKVTEGPPPGRPGVGGCVYCVETGVGADIPPGTPINKIGVYLGNDINTAAHEADVVNGHIGQIIRRHNAGVPNATSLGDDVSFARAKFEFEAQWAGFKGSVKYGGFNFRDLYMGANSVTGMFTEATGGMTAFRAAYQGQHLWRGLGVFVGYYLGTYIAGNLGFALTSAPEYRGGGGGGGGGGLGGGGGGGGGRRGSER